MNWKDFSKATPNKGEHVLVYTDNGEYEIATYRNADGIIWADEVNRPLIITVTEWASLNQPPTPQIKAAGYAELVHLRKHTAKKKLIILYDECSKKWICEPYDGVVHYLTYPFNGLNKESAYTLDELLETGCCECKAFRHWCRDCGSYDSDNDCCFYELDKIKETR